MTKEQENDDYVLCEILVFSLLVTALIFGRKKCNKYTATGNASGKSYFVGIELISHYGQYRATNGHLKDVIYFKLT